MSDLTHLDRQVLRRALRLYSDSLVVASYVPGVHPGTITTEITAVNEILAKIDGP